jgi:pimeloyl-ACP methyl ester carboxylesterase
MLHGGSGRWQLYAAMLGELAGRCHVYAPDLRGHGASGWVPGGYTINDYVEDIAAFLREVSGPAVLMGHSLGGIIAVAAAKACPELVRALIVGDGPLDGAAWGRLMRDGRGKLAAWRTLAGGKYAVDEIERRLLDAPEGSSTLREMFGEGSPIIHDLAERLYHHDPDMLGMLIEEFEQVAAGYDMQTVLPAIRCPVMLVQADPAAGGALTDEEVQQALPLLAHPTHLRFSGMDHLLIYDPKGPPMQAVTAFLDQLDPPHPHP